MFPRSQRLNGRIVNALYKKGQRVFSLHLSRQYFPQARYKSHSQISCHIAKKAQKSAVWRNVAKRAILATLKSLLTDEYGPHYKLFITLNKRALEARIDLLATKNKQLIQQQVRQRVMHERQLFHKKAQQPAQKRPQHSHRWQNKSR